MKAHDLTGQKFGRWTVLRLDVIDGVRKWICRCECGNEGSPVVAKLLSGRSKSCGCLRVNGDHYKTLALSGQVFGRWTVVERSIARNGKHYSWTCRCECGVVKDVLATGLTSGTSKSCGCLRVELTGEYKTKHGAARRGNVTPEFATWNSMMGRCDGDHENYGGRGIYVCQRWQTFQNFAEDMPPRPSRNYSIDRVNNATTRLTALITQLAAILVASATTASPRAPQ